MPITRNQKARAPLYNNTDQMEGFEEKLKELVEQDLIYTNKRKFLSDANVFYYCSICHELLFIDRKSGGGWYMAVLPEKHQKKCKPRTIAEKEEEEKKEWRQHTYFL